MKPESDIDLRRISEVLSKHQVRYVVVGGLAVFLQGGETPTTDVDLAFDSERSNVERLADALQELNAYPRRWEKHGFRLSSNDLAGAWLHLESDAGQIDLIVNPPGIPYSEIEASLVRLDIGGAILHVASRESLLKMKRAAGRQKDQRHIEELEGMD